jgi:glycosyltransferase involved in cell wall biosynthesis
MMLSLISPSYNMASLLDEYITAVKALSGADFILVDDGSTNASLKQL